jgi:hypothetical protein
MASELHEKLKIEGQMPTCHTVLSAGIADLFPDYFRKRFQSNEALCKSSIKRFLTPTINTTAAMPYAFAVTRPVNPPGVEPVITEEQLWKGLEYKARNPAVRTKNSRTSSSLFIRPRLSSR